MYKAESYQKAVDIPALANAFPGSNTPSKAIFSIFSSPPSAIVTILSGLSPLKRMSGLLPGSAARIVNGLSMSIELE